MTVVLRGATVVDGTGAPARRVDVLVEGDRIAEVGRIPRGIDGEEIDLDGLVLAPGFIDPHTHYDAQVLWDPELTPSSWHGVTTVVMGNCGFTLAPNHEDSRRHLMEMLTNVEGMSYDTLATGIPWTFTTYAEYLDEIASRPIQVNVASMVGHSTVRYAVMGSEAMDREATDDEIAKMRRLVDEALQAGAVGFSTSRSPSHVGALSKPVPSRVGRREEIWELAAPLRVRGAGTLEATWGPDLFVEEFARLADEIERPVSWAAVLSQRGQPEWTCGIREMTASFGGDVHPQMACKPLTLQIDLSRPGTMAAIPAFAAALSQPLRDRLALFGDSSWRQEAATQVANHGEWAERLGRAVVQESVGNPDLVGGESIAALARQRHTTPLELVLDLVLQDELQTRFSVVLMNDAEDEVAEMLADKRLLLGLSDAGAHTAQLCDADAPTYLLGHWWRERQAISLEDAVWRLTAHPAEVFGLAKRGRIAPGLFADLVAFNPDTVSGRPLERRNDLPGGSDRLVVQSTGVEHVWVRGQSTRAYGRRVRGAYPGALLRGGRG
jgi:N-acyl-D-aspartate/D-glutamate deacylase